MRPTLLRRTKDVSVDERQSFQAPERETTRASCLLEGLRYADSRQKTSHITDLSNSLTKQAAVTETVLTGYSSLIGPVLPLTSKLFASFPSSLKHTHTRKCCNANLG